MTAAARPEFRAAGTDLSERRRSGVSQGEVIDLVATSESSVIRWAADGAVRIGAATTVGAIAADARLSAAYAGLGAAAAGLATPQIRRLATLGGNLAQRSRCWYYRNGTSPASRRAARYAPRAPATTSTASSLISGRALPRIPQRSPPPCSLMRQ